MKKSIAIVSIIALTSVSVTGANHNSFKGRNLKDSYPLHNILQYEYQGNQSNFSNPNELLGTIVQSLDIEKNERYMKTGEVYKNGKSYSIPLWEFQDFDINKSRTNTYCNIFTIDVLNIMANTLKDETYRISKSPVLANSLRIRFENSEDWEEVSKSEAVESAQGGHVVVMSYVKSPHGHVAFVRHDSTDSTVYLWNVGGNNSEKSTWTNTGATKYFRKN